MAYRPDYQLILPTDKRNPSLCLYLNEDETILSIYYGLELMDSVPNDPGEFAYKLTIGRLYNMGIRVRTLEETFGIDRKTMANWGKAMLSRDPGRLAHVLSGRKANRKRTPQIDKFVVKRAHELQAAGTASYRSMLVAEVEEIFGIKLSGETIRKILKGHQEAEAAGASPEESDDGSLPPPDGGHPGEVPWVPEGMTTNDDPGEDPLEPDSGLGRDETSGWEEPLADSKPSPPNWSTLTEGTVLCDHVGMLVFAAALGSLPTSANPPEPLLGQWLGAILLGALNVEQTKYLNWEDLGNLLGQTVRFPTAQREQLTRLATPAAIDAVLRWNYRQIDAGETRNDLYYDPHTTHYTGAQKVLKGWCASIRWADKLINADFIHTPRGQPVYFECTDNFEDLRARFQPMVKRLRACLGWSGSRELTFIVDRGIYGNQVFTGVLAEPGLHLITWEKGYQAENEEPWETLAGEHRAAGTHGEHDFNRRRNNSRDQRHYHFEYIHRPWHKNPAILQIVVRATNPVGRMVQLSILTTDRKRAPGESVKLIFNRWLQENDFKYLDKHFGINQLTSYRSTPYEQLRDQLVDRQVPGRAYVESVKTSRRLDQQKARQLLASDRAGRDEKLRQQQLAGLLSGIALRSGQPLESAAGHATKEESRQIARLRTASRMFVKYQRQREVRIEIIHGQILQNEQKKAALEKEVSRIDTLVEQEMVRMDLRNKTLMDAIKISARNLFYRHFEPFKVAYDNYRDDHDYYRQLTQCDGALRWTADGVEVHLVPQVNFMPKLRKIIQAHLEDLNTRGLTMPNGSGQRLKFFLTDKERISVRINDTPNP